MCYILTSLSRDSTKQEALGKRVWYFTFVINTQVTATAEGWSNFHVRLLRGKS